MAGRTLAVGEQNASAAGRAGIGGVGGRREARRRESGACREEVLAIYRCGGVEERRRGGGSGEEGGEHAMPVEILGGRVEIADGEERKRREQSPEIVGLEGDLEGIEGRRGVFFALLAPVD